MSSSFALVLATSISLSGAPMKPGERWWSHIRALADDQMEGRDTGSQGYRKAAEYVAQKMKRIGLEPAGTNDYFQPVAFRAWRIKADHCQAELLRDEESVPLSLDEDAHLSERNGPPPVVEAPVVFIGYGLRILELNYDDLADADLKGKIALYFNGGPSFIPTALSSHYQSRDERWKALRAAGAIGSIAIPDPDEMDIPWERLKLARFHPSMTLGEPALNETADQKLSMTVNPEQAEKWFWRTGHTFAELQRLRHDGKPLPRFALAQSIRAKVGYETARLTADNVIGRWPGSDPNLKNEYVVVSAHLDHLGIGQPIHGDRIYNGAMDNASGVAALLDIAESLRESKARPRRSILFAVVTGEEKGLLGSRYFAVHPTVPSESIVANINLDMFLPLYPFRILTVLGLNESDLGDDARAVGKALRIAVERDQQPKRNVFIRSDQYSFIRRGVPSLALKIGFTPGSPEAAKQKAWLTMHYHAPSDDLNQPVDLSAAASFEKAARALLEAVANRADRPQWKSDSFFRRYALRPD